MKDGTGNEFDDDQRVSLRRQIADRLLLGSAGSTVHAEGGETYVWKCSPDTSQDGITNQLEGLAALFRNALEVGGRPIVLKPHFGVAAGSGAQASDVLAKAIRAAGQAAAGDMLWAIDTAEMATLIEDRHSLLAELPKALAERQLWVAYQPKSDIASSTICGAEALVRWHHPVRGPIAPSDFIPLLEQEQQVHEMTLYVLDTVLADLGRWTGQGHDPNIAVNLSGTLLFDGIFIAAVMDRLHAQPELARHLTFEVTESAAIANPQEAIAVLLRFVACGVRISIDDYGTGQSTLSYLQTFPASEIKIDQSFVRNIVASRSDQILVRSTIELAHQLDFKVVAEGVENAECLALLSEYQCDVAQGWHIARPMSAADFESTLSSNALAA